MTGAVTGDDGVKRCPWGASTPDYVRYHDEEWGRPTTDDRVLFEKLCLEGFQSGLSWLTILRKRPAFREVFADFDAAVVADYGPAEVSTLLEDARIVRHRGKIEATIGNARALRSMWDEGETLAGLIWRYEPAGTEPPAELSAIPSTTPESTDLSKELKRRGFRFVGPTTVYAAMQAMGVVNDHLVGCDSRQPCEDLRRNTTRPTD